MTDRVKGSALILLSALMFGSYGVWSKLIGTSFGPFFQGWTRALIILLALLPFLYYKKLLVPIQRADRRWLVVFLVFTSLTQAPLFYAFTHMDIGTATLLFYVGMLLTMYAIGLFSLGEKFSKIKWISVVLALSGLYITFSFSLTAFTFLAASMAVLNGIASGGEVGFSKKLTGSYSPVYVTFLSWLIILPTNLLLSIILKENQVAFTLDSHWLAQIGYSTVSLIGFWAAIAGFKYAEATVGSLLGLLEIVFSIMLGILIFHEILTGRVIVGAILIICAAALPHLHELIVKRIN